MILWLNMLDHILELFGHLFSRWSQFFYIGLFSMGFRSGAVGETPFVLWLIAGMIPWFYFSDAISTGTNSLIEYSYLVKK